MSVIYLIRHGEITQSLPRRFVGQTDLPLTDRGREQIAAVAGFLAGRGVGRLLCSPLSRCVQSAGIIGAALGIVPESVPDLREIALGTWEGLTVDEVRERFPGRYEARGRNLAGFRPPGGESFADVQRRAWTAFEETTADLEEPLAIVAHGGVNRVILCRILGMQLENLFRLEQDYACVNILHAGPESFRVSVMNFRAYEQHAFVDALGPLSSRTLRIDEVPVSGTEDSFKA
ncbi:MAG: histidine phosphatase family protein [Deltaproteobacteria bacterium HGW-Deltaproteobacteria-18]|jgi:probable phosphoglycerate mutase|nr:MAG: histidine phosphatase family protein [Deltaproteobacteria bacterium HGW-Deltaproteobacteria-20]PKN40812.1 MAG: histidine phosphatase family protein [Deltaproteobacteria bacterium HGW-Deltaproteobacteria-18]